MAALAISKALESQGAKALIKWPNDVLIAEKKVSGILAEASPDLSCVVIGFGINVNQSQAELPVDTATSLYIESGAKVDRDLLLASVVKNLMELYSKLAAAGGDADASGLRQEILQFSATVGSNVSVEFPDGKKAFGLATDIDFSGRLVLQTQLETLSVSAGDVLHLRRA
jgi:BirA family biotin operon repressor/biotin-[acetyl-CoA-carboxylase] ligase